MIMRTSVKYVILFLLLLAMSDLYAGGADCPVMLPPQYGGTIDMWGANYQPCVYKEWYMTLPDDEQYALLEYHIDINNSGAIDFVQVYVPDGNNGEIEVLDYDNAPMTGVLPIYTPNSTFRVVYLGATDGNSGLYNGFKISIHRNPDTSLFFDQVFYKNVGIGITPKARLHVNGYVRGDGTNGALRIKTKSGVTELGAQDWTSSHFNTDRSEFLFNKPVTLAAGLLRSSSINGNPPPLSLAYGDSTILSLTDTIVCLNAPLHVQSLRTDTIKANATRVVVPDSLTVLGPIRGGQACGSLRIKTTEGRVDIGSTHWGFMHFYTDRPKFYFNKPLSVDSGKITSYPRIPLQLQTFNTTRIYLDTTGNVGIGTVNPEYKLDVNGTIRATGVKVRTSSGADFVFESDYKLKPLSDVETFISTYNHLPEVPSAEDMKSEGIDVSDMQIKLLQKIEELTLYIIEQDKQIKALQETLESISK